MSSSPLTRLAVTHMLFQSALRESRKLLRRSLVAGPTVARKARPENVSTTAVAHLERTEIVTGRPRRKYHETVRRPEITSATPSSYLTGSTLAMPLSTNPVFITELWKTFVDLPVASSAVPDPRVEWCLLCSLEALVPRGASEHSVDTGTSLAAAFFGVSFSSKDGY